MKVASIPSGAAITTVRTGSGRLFSLLVTTAGTGSGNVIVKDGYGFSDLAIDSSNAKKVTSSSHSFVTGDVGLPLTIVSGTGFTAGTYTIASVTGGAAILSAAAGSTSSTSGVYTVGNGLSLFALPATIAVGTSYSVAPYGVPYTTSLQVTNVSSGPILTAVFD